MTKTMTPKSAHEYLRSTGAHFDWDHDCRVITVGCEGAGATFYDIADIWNRHVNACVNRGLSGVAILDAAGVE